jgi:competence protein ComEA
MLEGPPSRAPAFGSWPERVSAVTAALRREPRRVFVALACLAGAGIVLWWLFRPPTAAAPEVSLPRVSSTLAAGATGAVGAGPGTTAAPIVVHVAGAVARPGVLRLPAGSRVVDAVDTAGGLTADADAGRVNLAAKVADGQRVFVPRIGEAAPADATGATATDAGAASGPVDLNAATADQLDRLPGVGPATAAAIIEHRTRSGPFRAVDDLRDVPGIGDAKLAQLRPLVTV